MARQCVVRSATLVGVQAVPVDVEISIGPGIPGFSIVGMPDTAVRESQERVRSAIRASGFKMPSDKIVVNLAPSSLKKSGSGFDLPIAVALLVVTGQIPSTHAENTLWVGELSLDGGVRDTRGLMSYEVCAAQHGWDFVIPCQSTEFIPLEHLQVCGIRSLKDLRKSQLEEHTHRTVISQSVDYDYADIVGHDAAKRACQIAAAGRHGLLFMGPPGSGKTVLARALPSLLPPLTDKERIDTMRMYSVAGVSGDAIQAGERPFRAPHHSSSLVGLIGGGNPIRPGEISLAHNGVLFLDELAEFAPKVLQSLRQPLEKKEITIVRSEVTTTMPCDFMLVAASNPCPCGYFGDHEHRCSCSDTQIKSYQGRIGGPLLDRIDMHMDVWRVPAKDMLDTHTQGSTSAELRDGVIAAQKFRRERLAKDALDVHDGSGGLHDALAQCHLSAQDKSLFETMASHYVLSGRGMTKVLMVARTIADLANSYQVTQDMLYEAMALRVRDTGQE